MLDVDPGTTERLRLLGVATLGALAALPIGRLTRRFGSAARRWHPDARGGEVRPLTAWTPPRTIERGRYGEGTASSVDQVHFALHTLVDELAADLSRAGKSCGALLLGIECEDGEVREIAATCAQPTGDPAMLWALLRTRLEDVRLDAGVVGLRVRAERLEEAGYAGGLFALEDPDPYAVGLALARLAAMLGEGRARRAQLVAAHRIERRFSYEPFAYDGLRPDDRAGPSAAPPVPTNRSPQGERLCATESRVAGRTYFKSRSFANGLRSHGRNHLSSSLIHNSMFGE